jgi:hypothetical protein
MRTRRSKWAIRDLFDADYAHARTSDPATSHEAIPRNISGQALRVLWSYDGGAHLLDHRAYELAGLEGHQRCSDLRATGLIERIMINGVLQRGRMPSGKAGYLCRITPAGRAYLGKENSNFSDEKGLHP